MRSVQKTSPGGNVRFSNSSPKTQVGHTQQSASGLQTENGESVRVKVLDHLGGGKLVVDVKGQRVVANTNLWLEKGQEINVIIKDMGAKIIMQLMADVQNKISAAQITAVRSPLGDIIGQLMTSLESAEAEASPELDGALRELLQNVKGLIQQIPVDVTEEELPKQIQYAMEKLGLNYESNLARALTSGHFSKEDAISQLKAQLMQIQSASGDEPLHAALLENIGYMLENIEFQQLSSVSHDDDLLRFYFQLPVIINDQMTTAEIEFFRSKADTDQGGNRFGIVLNFDLERLGHIEFIVNVINKYINCQIKTCDYETYALTKKYAEDFESRLTAIGYDVGAIHCALDDSEAHSGQLNQALLDQQVAIDNIDITI